MKKRFTDTDKWADPWFRQLSPTAKLLWQWILDYCDNAGVLDPDWELAGFQIGENVIPSIVEIESRIERLENGAIFVPKFIYFQYLSEKKPTLSRESNAHVPIFASIRKYNLFDRVSEWLPEGYGKGMDGLPEGFPKPPRIRKGIRKGKGNGEGEGRQERSGAMVPTLDEVKQFAREVPCSQDCAVAYHADRSSISWTKVKGGIQVEIEDWRNDLRTFAMHWRNHEAERKRREDRDGKRVAKAVDMEPKKKLEL